jgi:hypothetical protein
MQQRLQIISKAPRHYRYNETKYHNININSGVNSANIILTSITGRVDAIFFVCRPSNALTGSATTSFTQLASFNLLNSSGTSLIGGQVVSDRVAQLALNFPLKDTPVLITVSFMPGRSFLTRRKRLTMAVI